MPSEFLPEVKELKTNYYRKSKQDDNLLIYDKQQVIKLVDSIKNTRYSVKFNIQNQPYNVLYNLILGKDVYGKKQEPFIIKYTINNFNEVYLNGKYDFSKMKGSIAIHKYYPFLSYLDNLKKTAHNKTEDGLIEDDPCSEYNNDGSSGGSPGRGSSSVSDPLEAEENQVQFEEPPGGGATSDGDATCNINLWYSSNTDLDNLFAITWSCTDGTKGNLDVKKSGKTDSLDCIKEGDVPVNEGENLCPEDKKCPCFGTISNIDTSNAFSSNTIINSIQSVLDAYGIKGDALDFLKQKEIFSPGTLTKTANDYIKGNKALGSVAGVLGIGISIAEYLEEPSTANLLRVAVDGAATTLPLAGSLSLTVIEILYENENGETIIDIILRAAAEAIEEAMDCDLGAGIHGLIF
ncbi:hypothetical protein [uncultured Polaribacter sp.]|uniref:hypothetical protein n=1 Tax=uncultured Polaribacter sp. TaxID=174711 RepID=UPI002612233C|nr:hypothetical protein [uncultured Polaribacter sp.]